MLEVLLGYVTSLSDIINYAISAIKSLFDFAENVDAESNEPDDEALLQSKSLFND